MTNKPLIIKISADEIKKANPQDFANALSKRVEDMVDSNAWYIDEWYRIHKRAEQNKPKPYWWHWLIRSRAYKYYIHLSLKQPDSRDRNYETNLTTSLPRNRA